MPMKILNKIEGFYNNNTANVLRHLFCEERMTPREIIKKFKKDIGVSISEAYLKDNLCKYKLVKKIAGRWWYNEDEAKCHKILHFYNMASMEEFIYKFYFKRAMSLGAIQKRILKDTKINITRGGLWRWIYWAGLWARSQRKGFNLGVQRKRFSHEKVAKKINYAKRKIDYIETSQKRHNTMVHYKYRSSFAFGLKNILLNKNLTTKDLANYLSVSHHCVKAWCALNNRVNKIYWRRLSAFADESNDKIFNCKPTKSQITKLTSKGIDYINNPFLTILPRSL